MTDGSVTPSCPEGHDRPGPKSGLMVLATYCESLGASILVWNALLLIYSAAALWVGGSIHGLPLPLSLASVPVFFLLAQLRGGLPSPSRLGRALVLSAIFVLLWSSAIGLSGLLLDTSVDGNWYHSAAIAELARGWNPLRDPPLTQSGHLPHRILHLYSKGAWLTGATIFSATGNIDYAKAPTILFAFSTLLLSFSTLTATCLLQPGKALISSILLAFNPVTIAQVPSLYVDGQVASLLTCLSLTLIGSSRSARPLLLVTLASTIVLLVDIKLSGVLFSLILGGLFSFWLFLARNKNAPRIVFAGLVAGLVATLFVGFNPYITNTRDGAWPEVEQRALFLANTPFNFRDRSGPVTLALSLLSRCDISLGPARLKIPFSVTTAELASLGYPDTRISGFGPWFGAAILLSILVLAFQLKRGSRPRPSTLDPAWLFLIITFASVAITPQSWWARYAPQLWTATVLLATLTWRSEDVKIRRLGAALTCVLFVNCALVSDAVVSSARAVSARMGEQLKALQRRTTPVAVNFGPYFGQRLRFKQLGIPFVECDRLPCAKPARLEPSGEVVFCPADGDP